MSRWTGLMSRNMTAAAPSVTAAVTPNRVGSGVVLMNPADQPAACSQCVREEEHPHHEPDHLPRRKFGHDRQADGAKA